MQRSGARSAERRSFSGRRVGIEERAAGATVVSERHVGLAHVTAVPVADAPERLADGKTVIVDVDSGTRLRVAALGVGAAWELCSSLTSSPTL